MAKLFNIFVLDILEIFNIFGAIKNIYLIDLILFLYELIFI